MSDWSRNDSLRLGRVAMQLGLAPYSADRALEVGARFLGHGFDTNEIDAMIPWQYKQWAENDD